MVMNLALVVMAVGDEVCCGWGCGEVGVTLTVQNAKTLDHQYLKSTNHDTKSNENLLEASYRKTEI